MSRTLVAYRTLRDMTYICLDSALWTTHVGGLVGGWGGNAGVKGNATSTFLRRQQVQKLSKWCGSLEPIFAHSERGSI